VFINNAMHAVMSWLNENGSAIQAVATVVLVGITGYYAYLTHRVVKLQEAVRRERMAELRSLVLTIRAGLDTLPKPSEKATAVRVTRDAVLWDDGDPGALRGLASWLNSEAGEHAAQAVPHLRWLGDWAREARSQTYNWEKLVWEKYDEHRILAERHVLAILVAITR